MRLVINIVAIIGLVIGVACVFQVYGLRGSESTSEGFANATIPFWGLLGAGTAIVFGFVGRIIDRRVPMPASKISDFSIAGGFLLGALILAVPFVFG